RVWIDLQEIERQVIGPERDRLIDRAQPRRERLTRQPEHEIETEIVEPGRTRIPNRFTRTGGRVDSSEPLQLLIVERLHTEADAVDAALPKCLESLWCGG